MNRHLYDQITAFSICLLAVIWSMFSRYAAVVLQENRDGNPFDAIVSIHQLPYNLLVTTQDHFLR